MWTNKEDPVMTCQPLGIPRQGPPRRIIQSANDIVFFYAQYADGGGGQAEYPDHPDRRPQARRAAGAQTTYMGYTVGSWDGDTLVLDSIAFNDFTWLSRGGFFHSDQMRVVERFTRQGNEILYEVTVEDPVVLVEPLVMTPRILRLNANRECGASAGARQLRSGVRKGGHRDADSALVRRDERLTADSLRDDVGRNIQARMAQASTPES